MAEDEKPEVPFKVEVTNNKVTDIFEDFHEEDFNYEEYDSTSEELKEDGFE